MAENEDPRKDDVLAMLRKGIPLADIMEKHRISHSMVRKWRRDAGIQPHTTGPRPRADEPTTDHDRTLFHKQGGNCWTCNARLLNWVRLAGRDGTCVALMCKMCLAKATPIVWDDAWMANLNGLRTLHPSEVLPTETPTSVGANYKTRNGPEVFEYRSKPGEYYVELGAGKYGRVEEKFVIYPA